MFPLYLFLFAIHTTLYGLSKSHEQARNINTVSNYTNNEEEIRNVFFEDNFPNVIIPLIQIKSDPETIKNKLNEFTLLKNNNSESVDNSKINLGNQLIDKATRSEGPKTSVDARRFLNVSVKTNDAALTRTDKLNEIELNQKGVNETDESTESRLTEKLLINILRKQTELIGKLAKAIKVKGKTKKSTEFDDLIKEMELRRDVYAISTFTEAETTTPSTERTTTEKMSTVLALFDEVQVRNALQNDPYVKRIMKMAKRKRAHYIKSAIRYYQSTNTVV